MKKAASMPGLNVVAPVPRRSGSLFFLEVPSPSLSRSPSFDMPLEEETKKQIKECLTKMLAYVLPLTLSDIFDNQGGVISFIALQIQFINSVREVLYPMTEDRKGFTKGSAEKVFASLHSQFREEVLVTQKVITSLSELNTKKERKALEDFIVLIEFMGSKLPKVEPKSPLPRRLSAGRFPPSPLSHTPPVSAM